MKMPLFILLPLALALPAATVPQDSAGKYFFSTPYSTNLVGTVIGDPPAYRTLRREDIAWIREAACERAALAQGTWWGFEQARLEPEFGRWPLSESNRFARFTAAREWRGGILETNIVVGWSLVTNAFGVGVLVARSAADDSKPDGRIDAFTGLSFGSGTGRYLEASSNDFRAVGTSPWNLPSHTNIVTSVTTNWGSYWGDDGLVFNHTTVVEHVTMAMTNGTVSVHTNTWTYSLPHVVTTVATNIEAGTFFDLLFASGAAPWLDASPPSAMRPFPAYSYVRDSYSLLRRMNMLAEATYNTNLFRSIVHRWEYDSHEDKWKMRPDTWTNETSDVGLFLDGVVIGYVAEGYESGNGRVLLPSRLRWDVLHTGGVCRVTRSDLYARVTAVLDRLPDGSYMTTNSGHCALRLGAASMLAGPQGGMACFEATVDGPAIARAGAAELGLPTYSSWTDWGHAEGSYHVEFFLVHHLAPWTSLPGWNE